jgi:hypothetical protein
MAMTLTDAHRKAAEMYRDPDNSLSFICSACGISNKAVYAAVDKIGVPRRGPKKGGLRNKVLAARKAARSA